jgi:predicted metal-binding membrane protein
MSLSQALSAVGLIRPTRRHGFCPACRLWAAAPPGEPGAVHVEIAPPALTALAFLAVAAIAWLLMVQQSRSMDGMAMGPGSLGPFAASWTVMMVAMMLPSALPMVFEFARNAEGRRGWHIATGVLGATYLSIWLAFGIACYVVRGLVPASWFDQRLVGAAALALAALYGVTPIKRASEARCRELCALHGPLSFNLMRSAMVVGVQYGLSCVGCSAALMVAMVVIGMANMGWIVVMSAVVLAYKLAPTPSTRRTLLLSTALVTLGVIYALMT